MAIMIPMETEKDAFNGSIGEERVYESLKNLPDDYYVFHSVHWNRRRMNSKIGWGESDYTVFNPKRGVIVIEVKSGGISCRDGKWIQKNLRTNEEKILKRSPLEQASASKYKFLELFDEKMNDYISKLDIEPVVWFPSVDDPKIIDSFPNNHSYGNVFLQNDLMDSENALDRAFSFYSMNRIEAPKKDDIIRVVNIFAPNFDAVQSPLGAMDDREFIFNKLTREQSNLIDFLEDQKVAAIQGAGGTGKTMLAVEKAIRLSNEPVLFLCFNTMLLKHLQKTYGSLYDNIDFHNLYSLCNQNTLASNIDESTILDYLKAIDIHTWKYKHIIIDEGQDFSSEQLDLLNIIAEEKEGCFYVFYDKNQLVQRFGEDGSWFDSVDCRLTLTKNCRNTHEIAMTSYSTIDIDQNKIKAEVSGEKPIIKIVDNNTAIINALTSSIQRYIELGYQKNQITILTLKTERTSILRDVERIGKYKIGTSDNSDIVYTSARKFKGLESDIVILVDFDEDTFYSIDNRKLFYVAASRAKHLLEIITDITDENIKNIVYYLDKEERKEPKIALQLAFKAKVKTEH